MSSIDTVLSYAKNVKIDECEAIFCQSKIITIRITDSEIAEVKQNKASASEFTNLMRELRVKQGGMSKYCIGVSNLVGVVKKNNFKEKNIKINKLNKI